MVERWLRLMVVGFQKSTVSKQVWYLGVEERPVQEAVLRWCGQSVVQEVRGVCAR